MLRYMTTLSAAIACVPAKTMLLYGLSVHTSVYGYCNSGGKPVCPSMRRHMQSLVKAVSRDALRYFDNRGRSSIQCFLPLL